ncbi:class I SAM-dependent methyltransferase [Streptomyces virginiae]|uniref:class I SAM-dependent methyltransferase n=1 Tax=Streptomyces virginiae TaxID=1961 RepID=UPI00069F8877|nr:class I SAM-dependent methyltransferase [Streptomyces virginiae]
MTTRDETLNYFRIKADEYDDVDAQSYWRLSDDVLKSVLSERILPHLAPGSRFLDAGGGTGRWSDFIARNRTDLTGMLYDLSPDMARHAQEKAERGGYSDRFTVVNDNLDDVFERLSHLKFDLIFNFHNVLGFVEDPQNVVQQLSSLLNPGGRLISFVPNRYHAAFFNLGLGRISDAEQAVETGAAKFTKEMPTIKLFTPGEMDSLYTDAGLEMEFITGFPSLIYPGHLETQLHGQTESLANLLEDSENFARIFHMERQILDSGDIAARGNNIFAVGRRAE